MVYCGVKRTFHICYTILLFIHEILSKAERVTDQTSPRANTLYDDADDIQRQLDNEARDRLKYGRPKTVWVFHLPTQFPDFNPKAVSNAYWNFNTLRLRRKENGLECSSTPSGLLKEWNYKGQDKWSASYPGCGGNSQSPVDLPVKGLIKTKGARKILFCNYNAVPTALTLRNDGRTVTLYGEWEHKYRPLVYGGAAHSRRYVFHSLILHWPSEHVIGGLNYPLETQVLHISAEYKDLKEALAASLRDPQAILGIANLYKFENRTQKGLNELIKTAKEMGQGNGSVSLNSLSYFSPPLKEYACYQGSLSTPPCTESVLWLVRGRTLPVTRKNAEEAQSLLGEFEETGKIFIRHSQPLNDRRVFFFK